MEDAPVSPFANDLPTLEASLEVAVRAAGATSPAVQRSAHTAAVGRAEALIQAVSEALDQEETFVDAEGGAKVISEGAAELLERRVPLARRLSETAGAPVDEWVAEVREMAMQRLANSSGSQYLGAGHREEWPCFAGVGGVLRASFQLSRGGLVSYALAAVDATGAELGKIQGEGIWTFADEERGLTEVRLDMRQGLTGRIQRAGSGFAQVCEPARTLRVPLREFRRVRVPDAEACSSDDPGEESDETDGDGEPLTTS